jgi:hypothetical protein
MPNYLGRAGAYAVHKKYPTGSQTSAQINAERENLKKARLARGQMRHTKSATYHGLRTTTMKSRGTSGVARAYNMRDIQLMKNRAIGVRYMKYFSKGHLKRPTITGKPKKFIKRKSPGRYYGRTSWGSAKSPKFKKRLTKRQHRFKTIKRWKVHGKRWTPR